MSWKSAKNQYWQSKRNSFEPILKEIETLIKEIGKDGGYNLILEKRLVTLYVDPSYDLTEAVIQTLNERYDEANPPKPSEKNAEKSETPQ